MQNHQLQQFRNQPQLVEMQKKYFLILPGLLCIKVTLFSVL